MNSRIMFGFVDTGFIADFVANAIKDTEAKLVAVADQRRESADAFTDKQGGHHPVISPKLST